MDDREPSLTDMLSQLPSVDTVKHDFTLEEGDALGVQFCGDQDAAGRDIYKLLTQQGVMVTFVEDDGTLRYIEDEKIHR